MSQKIFEFNFPTKNEKDNFFVNHTNQHAYNLSIKKNFEQNIFLYGPEKSGKTYLINLWKDHNNALIYNNNFSFIIESKNNIAIDDVLISVNEEELFHIINHCRLFNLKIFITSSIKINDFKFKLLDLYSRLRSFYYTDIKKPDDEMCKMFLTKLFLDKQIVIKNKEIFDYVFTRINRSYNDIFKFVETIDQLSLEKKRQLTIPLIKEIL